MGTISSKASSHEVAIGTRRRALERQMVVRRRAGRAAAPRLWMPEGAGGEGAAVEGGGPMLWALGEVWFLVQRATGGLWIEPLILRGGITALSPWKDRQAWEIRKGSPLKGGIGGTSVHAHLGAWIEEPGSKVSKRAW